MTQPVRAAAQRVRWHAVGDTDALCEAAFAYIADAATSAIERHQRFLIVLSGGNALQIADVARKSGINDLRASALKKVRDGFTSLAEINRVTKD